MRTVLVTGPGGAGRSTVAAAIALAAARRSTRTLLLGADRGGSLQDALGRAVPVGPPAEIAPGLLAARLGSDQRFRDDLLALQDRAGTALDMLGASRLDGDELTPLPGAGELALLRALRDAHTHGAELVVVDLPATPTALATLALPEELRRYLRRLLPPERQAARALRPLLGKLAGVPMPADWLYSTAARWDAELAAVETVLADPGTTVRLVAEPGPAGAEAVRTARTGLALYGLRADALIANRVLPGGGPDEEGPWFSRVAAQQEKTLAEWRAGELPLSELRHLGHDPRGADDLAELAAHAGGPGAAPHAAFAVPGAATAGPWRLTDRRAEEDPEGGTLVWHIPLPGATRDDLDLVRRGDELVVTAGPFRRIVALPSVLRRCAVAGAGLREGELLVRFVPDPTLWPREQPT
ncbi:ArsA family ATPase [Streptomyces tsukubensis]|uniref:ArsA family ATPase n=1 Tax=Streptomyces tsukubensis TaxID=83656 RepID=A0A1V4A7H5_9ACTN|nr:ArsA-related P-loop ATPase [Streptomyces tsukubensis]OON77663.1 hypothetical protein B1H18_18205 [Streptomyces tsukubensis]QFR93172.1 ArsA family ATPase [Streptomyces tsukubensis]